MKGQRVLDISLVTASIAMVLYHLVSSIRFLEGPIEQQNTHLAFALVIVFLSAMKKRGIFWRIALVLLVLISLACTAYVRIFSLELQLRAGFNTLPDLIIGSLLIIVVLEATRLTFGWVLPGLGVIAIVYFFLGEYLPAPFTLPPFFPPEVVISRLSIGLSGIYGSILSISVNYIFLFVVFGALFAVSGATRFFIQIGKLLGTKLRGGPGLTAVVSSALVGMVTGSVTANIVTTGSFTIPLMKRVGYQPWQAGAIEATASTGGQIMPPIMGAAAFLMAGVTGVPYLRIMELAAMPAILYFLSCGMYVQLWALKAKLSFVKDEKVETKELLLNAPLFVVPLLVLVALLVMGYGLMYTATWAIVAVVVLGVVRKRTRPPLRQWVESFSSGGAMGAEIGVSCACIGMLVIAITETAIGLKIGSAIGAWSGGNVVVALVLAMLLSLFLGTGIPTTGAYILVAVTAVPLLIQMGVPLLAAHFFAFYFACLSHLSPPVAIGALVASKLAGAPYIRTALESTKLALAALVIPYFIVWSPVLQLRPEAPVIAAARLLTCVAIILSCQILVVGHYLTTCNSWQRAVIALVGGAGGMIFLATTNYAYLAAVAALFISLTLWQWRKKRLLSLAYERSLSKR